jgi:cytoskeletal protein CcmA (bactofilin family)
MIKKLIAKKQANILADKTEQLKTNGSPAAAKSHGRTTVLERSPEYHVDRLQDMMTARPPSPQPGTTDLVQRSVLIGLGVEFDGIIRDCDEVVIEGTVTADIKAVNLLIREAGIFSGSAAVEKAEIDGQYDGTLTASSKLLIHETGRVAGDINYAQLEVSSGGILTGEVSVFTDAEEKRRLEQPHERREATQKAAADQHPGLQETKS